MEDPSRCVGEVEKTVASPPMQFADELDLSESDSDEDVDTGLDDEDLVLEDANSRIESLASSEKTDPTRTGYSGYPTLGSSLPSKVGKGQQPYVVLKQPGVQLHSSPDAADEHQFDRIGCKRKNEDCSSSPVGPSPSTSRPRKKVCDVAPAGSQGSFDFNSFAPSESWNDVMSSEAFNFSKDGKKDEELRKFQELYSQLRSRLPLNSIDYLIYLLGGKEKVAELSGRKHGIKYEMKPDQNGKVRPYGTSYARGKTADVNTDGTEVVYNFVLIHSW